MSDIIKAGETALNATSGTMSGVSTTIDLAKNMSPPINRASIYGWNDLMPNQLPTLDDMFRLRRWGEMGNKDLTDRARMLGFSPAYTSALYKTSLNSIGALDAIVLYRRGKLTKENLVKQLERQGFYIPDLELLLDATEYFPSPNDLIQFAVRDVYTPETVEAYRLKEDLPPVFLTEAKKAGLPKEQAENYWAAHWQLPSLSAVTTMLHRGLITIEEYAEFLKIADYSPAWRKKIEDISYQPLTRVDVRRMYEIGVVDREKVKKNFKDLGYNEENAELMTQFTTIYDAPETKGLTRTTITNAYVDGQITITDVNTLLEQIGFAEPMLSFWIKQAQYDKARKQISLRVDSLFELFLSGGNALDDLRNELYRLDLPEMQVNQLIEEAIIKRASKRKIPDLQTLVRWLQEKLIDEKQFTLRMRLLNYNEDDIHTYLSEIAIKEDTSTRKYLSDKVYQRWLTSGIMDELRFEQIMKEQGYSQKDIDAFKIEARSKQNETE